MDRDWMDMLLFGVQLASLVGTAAAALLAYWTIRQAKRHARDAQDALIRERQLDFELDTLKDLVLAVTRADILAVKGLAIMLPISDIPLTRAAIGLPSTPDATSRVQLDPAAHPTKALVEKRDELSDELGQAITARINQKARRP